MRNALESGGAGAVNLAAGAETGTLAGERAAAVILSRPDRSDRLAVLEAVLDTVAEGVIATDEGGRIIYYNAALAAMEGLDPRAVIGRHLTEVYRVTRETSEHMTAVRTGEPVRERPRVFFTVDGREINLTGATYPVRAGGRTVGAFSVCRDLTRIKDLLNRNLVWQKQVAGMPPNGTRYTFEGFVYRSRAMERLLRQAEKAAKSDCTVLVYGETGTGKEVLVQSLHNASPRRVRPFVGINCAAIPETLLESTLFGTVKGAFTGAVNSSGLFEEAAGGTLFLDEINSMSLTLQAKLLRVLQERTYRRLGAEKELPVKCRIFTSTNLDPQECIRRGTLREDLYYRFAVFTVFLPPLRERPEDVEVLADFFIRRYASIYGLEAVRLDGPLREAFARYPWPGNVRELEHVIESCLAMLEPGEETITADHLPGYVRARLVRRERPKVGTGFTQGTLHAILEETERRVIEEVLQRNQGNVTRSARDLGILRQNLQYRMRRLGIRAGDTC